MDLKAMASILAMTAAAAGLAACDVDVNDAGELPEVEVKGGRAPDVDVTPPDVDVGTKETTMTVPDIDVDIPDEEDNEPIGKDSPPVNPE